jgi:hypothetical protein
MALNALHPRRLYELLDSGRWRSKSRTVVERYDRALLVGKLEILK